MQKAIEPGLRRALNYAFPPNQLELCGKKLKLDEYRRLYDDAARAQEFLMSLPFLGKSCSRIAALKKTGALDDLVINAYFLGIGPHQEKGRPLTHLMDILLTDAAFLGKEGSEASRSIFLARINLCAVRLGTITSADSYGISANMQRFVFAGNGLAIAVLDEQLRILPFNSALFTVGQMIAVHGNYAIEELGQVQYSEAIKETEKEITLFNGRESSRSE